MNVNMNPASGLASGVAVDAWILIRTAQTLSASNGNKYLKWSGFDALGMPVTGTYYGRGHGSLDNADLAQLILGGVYATAGVMGDSRSGLQIWAKNMQQIDDPEAVSNFKDVCYPSVPKEELAGYIAQLKWLATDPTVIEDEGLRTLATALFAVYEPYLWKWPAGRSNHEPVRGGLAKHTYEVITILYNQMLYAKGMNKDVLIFSAMYHDFGKIDEYTENIEYNQLGFLLTHPIIAIKRITKLIIEQNIEVSDHILQQVEHCIVSHHGKEFGAVTPSTREALALHHADGMMSSIGHIEVSMRQGTIGENGWGNWSNWVGGYIYVPEMDTTLQ